MVYDFVSSTWTIIVVIFIHLEWDNCDMHKYLKISEALNCPAKTKPTEMSNPRHFKTIYLISNGALWNQTSVNHPISPDEQEHMISVDVDLVVGCYYPCHYMSITNLTRHKIQHHHICPIPDMVNDQWLRTSLPQLFSWLTTSILILP